MVLQGSLSSPSAIRLLAASGHLVVDEQTNKVWIEGAPIPDPESPKSGSNESQIDYALKDAAVHDFRMGSGVRILVVPLGAAPLRVSGELEGATLSRSTTSDQTFTPRASTHRPALTVGAADSVQLQADSPSPTSLTVAAPFLLVLWDTNVTLEDSNGTREVDTGEATQPAPAVGDLPLQQGKNIGSHVQREAYFQVDEGSLTVPLEHSLQVFASSPRIAIRDGWLQLEDPQGILPTGSAVPVGSHSLRLSAPFTVGMDQTDRGTLGLSFQSLPAKAVLDGVTLQPARGTGALPLGFALVALAGLSAAGGIHFSRSRFARKKHVLDSLLRGRHYDLALLAAKTIVRGPYREDARLTEAVCLIHTKRFREAQGVLEGKRKWSAVSAAMRYYLLANAEAGQGRPGEAATALVECLARAPRFAAEARINPLLQGILETALATVQRSVDEGWESYA
jgi:hypothetical protein